jgi:hypothetical protein
LGTLFHPSTDLIEGPFLHAFGRHMDAGDEHIADMTPEPIILQLIAALVESIICFQGQLAVKTYVSLTAVQCRAGRMLISEPPKAVLIGPLDSKGKLG